MGRRFVREPELGAIDRKAGDHFSLFIRDAIQFLGSEGPFIKLDGRRAHSDREKRRERRFQIARGGWSFLAHRFYRTASIVTESPSRRNRFLVRLKVDPFARSRVTL